MKKQKCHHTSIRYEYFAGGRFYMFVGKYVNEDYGGWIRREIKDEIDLELKEMRDAVLSF